MSECCAECRPQNNPFASCRRKLDCTCHHWQDTLAKNTPIPNTHRDPTYYAAMNNIRKSKR